MKFSTVSGVNKYQLWNNETQILPEGFNNMHDVMLRYFGVGKWLLSVGSIWIKTDDKL